MHHLRNSDPREWSEFTEHAEKELRLHFSATPQFTWNTVELRQYDVKQNWHVLINEHDLGILVSDEKDITTYFKIPEGTLHAGDNVLRITCNAPSPDDISVGEVSLDTRQLKDVLSEASLDITVTDENGTVTPSRITIVNEKGSFQTVTTQSPDRMALRPGCVYSWNDTAAIQLPAGKYMIYAGRGFEYGVDSVQVALKAGDHIRHTLQINREVQTDGWVSSDTHIHTSTHSHHGDATVEERALTIAGEGIELPILTDHNVYVDISPFAKTSGLSQYFTPVTGDELTTRVGHFNVFPIQPGTSLIKDVADDWIKVSENLAEIGKEKVIILNHARDIHNGFRPFNPSRHISSAGVSHDDWTIPANAMEVVNSGSQQTDIMLLYRDWFGMLNGGHYLTPIGSSDSHDVSRYTVGQARTYIQGKDADAGHIDIDEMTKSMLQGRVLVSCGLFTKITVNKRYGPGDIVQGKREVEVAVEVFGPGWVKADKVSIFANGIRIIEQPIVPSSHPGLKWKGSWNVPLPDHDIYLVAIAEGPGHAMPFWPIAKPYQPMSTDWRPRVIGSTGAVWVDADRNGKRDSAYDYANHIVNSSRGNLPKIVRQLASYDEAVAIQVVSRLWKNGSDLEGPAMTKAMESAELTTRRGFDAFMKEMDELKK